MIAMIPGPMPTAVPIRKERAEMWVAPATMLTIVKGAIGTNRTTAHVFNTINEDVSKLNAKDTQKIELIKELANKRFNFDAIDALLG